MTTPDALHRLTAALDALASALESGEPGRVLEAEAPLAAAMSAIAGLDLRGAPDRLRVRRSVDEARRMLARCQALGASIDSLVDVMFPAPAAYGPQGHIRSAPGPAPTLDSRT